MNINSIKVCADVLGIDLIHLLTLIDDNKEVAKLNDKEVALIETVFAECVSIMHQLRDANRLLTDNREENHIIWRNAKQEYFDSLSKAHMKVDASSLFVSSSVKYRLHRILNDMTEEHFVLGYSERWDEINSIYFKGIKDHFAKSNIELSEKEQQFIDFIDEYNMSQSNVASPWSLIEYDSCVTRQDGLEAKGVIFLDEEKCLAEKLGYRYSDIPDSYYDNFGTDGRSLDENGNIRDLSSFGIEDSEFEITPIILFKDSMTRIIKLIFENDFPELSFPE